MVAKEAFITLKHFIETKMRMSREYQPAILKILLQSGGKAHINKLAEALFSYDEAQKDYYKYIIGRHPTDVLVHKHKILYKKGQTYYLDMFGELSKDERDKLIALCNEKLEKYFANILKKAPAKITASKRYQVLQRAGGRCALCKSSSKDYALDVDHIVPKNMGGSDDLANLQALCYRCNRAKRDTDTTNWHEVQESFAYRQKECEFCTMPKKRIEISGLLCVGVRDLYPVSKGHSLIIPKRHVESFFELYQTEINDMLHQVKEMKQTLQAQDKAILGFNLGINDGVIAGQTISHCHLHLIPRRKGDHPTPRGGIRNIFPNETYNINSTR